MNYKKGNKLIAEFMECTHIETPVYEGYKGIIINGLPEEYTPIYTYNNLSYHRLWDWLIPVLKKIGDLPLEIEECSHRITPIRNALLSIDIERTYAEVVEFIKWYNKYIET